MGKKAITRKEKYEDYRNKINEEDNLKNKDIVFKQTKPKLNSLIIYFNKKRLINYCLYYIILGIITIAFIILFIYFGIYYL